MKIITGGAHSAYGKTSAGDQKQTSIPDYSGEVSLREFTSIDGVKSRYKGYWVYRPKNSKQAYAIARIMEIACNNEHIGYSQSSRQGIFTYGANTLTDCNCDCSSLVSYCVQEGTGARINATTSYLGGQLNSSGLFNTAFPVSSYNENNPPCTGDILLLSGSHTELVVSGSNPSGTSIPYSSMELESLSTSSFPMSNYQVTKTNVIDTFVPRTKEPKEEESSYELFYKQSYGESKNGSYAWGRFSEIIGSECTLSKGPVRRWYLMTEDGYSRGLSPSLGSVMCFTNVMNSQDSGFACVVEGISSDYIYVSMISPSTGNFEYAKLKKKDNSWNQDLDGDGNKEYLFQGFIYNPCVQAGITTKSLFTEFIETAKNKVGDDGTFVNKYTHINTKTGGWSAAFIVAVANKVGGLTNVIIPETFACSAIGSIGLEKGMGTWLDGPCNNGIPYPQPGDIALFRNANRPETSRKFDADKAAIVISIDSLGAIKDETNKTINIEFSYIIGDSSGKVECKSARSNTNTLSGIFRPNWDKVETSLGVSKMQYNLQGFYAQGASLEDAAIKDFKYINVGSNGVEPSINSKGLMLCAINYSGIIGSVYNIFASVLSSNSGNSLALASVWNNTSKSIYDLTSLQEATTLGGSAMDFIDVSAYSDQIPASGSVKIGNETLVLTDTVKSIYIYLKNLFGNPAGAVGFMANMWAESRFRTSAVNGSSGASGLCQWLAGRKTGMIDHCSSFNGIPWKENLSGQLDYLRKELNESYKSTLRTCKECSTNLSGAKVAAEYVLRHFEIPGHYDVNVPLRNGYAEAIWKLFFGSAT